MQVGVYLTKPMNEIGELDLQTLICICSQRQAIDRYYIPSKVRLMHGTRSLRKSFRLSLSYSLTLLYFRRRKATIYAIKEPAHHSLTHSLTPDPLRSRTEQRTRLIVFVSGFGFGFPLGEVRILSAVDLGHQPSSLLLGRGEEFLVLLERTVPRLRAVQVCEDARDGVGGGKDQQEPVLEAVEADRGEEGDGEIGQAPDDDGDGSALGSRRRGEDLGRDQPGGHEPADAKDRGRRVQDHDTRDAGRELWDRKLLAVGREPSEHRDQSKGYAEPECPL